MTLTKTEQLAQLDEKPSIIAIMGCTGVGKSTFVKTTGAVSMDPEDTKSPLVGDNLESCTSEPKLFTIPETNIVLIDTPGFNDTNVSDREMLRRISNVLATLHADKTDISGMLYLHPIDDARMTGSAKKNLDMFKKVVGAKNMSRCVLVTTKWSREKQDKANSHEAELTTKFWKPMFDAGVKYARFEDTRQSALGIVSPLCKGESLVPKVIVEWAQEGKSLHETEAGRAVEDDVEQAKKVAQQDIQDVRQEKAEALRAKDFEAAKALERERKGLEQRLLQMEEEREKLRVEYEEQRRRQEARWEVQRKEVEAQRKREVEIYQTKQREEAERWQAKQQEYEKQRQSAKQQREDEKRAWEDQRRQSQREYEERHTKREQEFARKEQIHENRKGRWARRVIYGALGTGALVFSGGLAAPVVAGLAIKHEVDCQEEKKKE